MARLAHSAGWAFRMCNDGGIRGEKFLFGRMIFPFADTFLKLPLVDSQFFLDSWVESFRG